VSVPVSQSITRQSASNLAPALLLLPDDRRSAMSALYAFCREVDDVADEDAVPMAERRARLAAWREDIRLACEGGRPQLAVNQELQPVIQHYGLPFIHFDDLIRGCEMDLDTFRYAGYAELDLYCYRVASVVGLLSIAVFGCQDPQCTGYATALGKALQLTNILRDVSSDADRGRIYLPQTELARFGVRESDVLAHHYSPSYRALAASVADRARGFFRQARELMPPGEGRALVAAELMATVYWRLLRKLERRGFNVFGPCPVRLSKVHKLALIARAWWRLKTGSLSPGYG
jgi:phytoene synthase